MGGEQEIRVTTQSLARPSLDFPCPFRFVPNVPHDSLRETPRSLGEAGTLGEETVSQRRYRQDPQNSMKGFSSPDLDLPE